VEGLDTLDLVGRYRETFAKFLAASSKLKGLEGKKNGGGVHPLFFFSQKNTDLRNDRRGAIEIREETGAATRRIVDRQNQKWQDIVVRCVN
jgi:hypothetical protein